MKKEIISRTITTNYANCLMLDADRKIAEKHIIVPARIKTTDAAESYIRKNALVPADCKLIEVTALDPRGALVGMYISDFVDNATLYKERSKETRDCVTKDVVSYIAHYEYLDNGHKLAQGASRIPAEYAKSCETAEKYLRKTKEYIGKLVDVYDISKNSGIYAMSEVRFMELAKPMSDRFHLIEE